MENVIIERRKVACTISFETNERFAQDEEGAIHNVAHRYYFFLQLERPVFLTFNGNFHAYSNLQIQVIF